MKITCTKSEKEQLIAMISSSPYCLLDKFLCNPERNCDNCLSKNIEWEVTDDDWMTVEKVIEDLGALRDFFEEETGATPLAILRAMELLSKEAKNE